MKLLTEKIKKELPKLGSTKGIPLKNKKVICKFINPIGPGDWYVFEGEAIDGDYICYGVVKFNTSRVCKFSIKELEKKRFF